MKSTSYPASLLLAGLTFAPLALDSAHAANLLTNPGFEQPQVAAAGNNFPVTLPGWTLQTTITPCENGHNVVRGGAAYDGGPDNAAEGMQYYDICGSAGYLRQTFTLASASAVSFGASFSRRDLTGGGGNVEIYDAANTALIAASTAVSVAPVESQELWVQSRGVTASLAAGTYVVRVNIEDAASVDAVFVTPTVPVVVGNAAPASVTETVFNSALAQDGASPITFNGGSAPLTLNLTGTKTINRNVIIDGGNRITLNGQGSVQIFVVNPSVTLELRNITLDRGYAGTGGAISNRGNVVLNNVRFTNCTAGAHGGAIQNSAILTATGCRFDYNRALINGGAIDNTGRLVLTNCSASGNKADFRGGAFYNYLGTSDLTGCQIKWNTANAYGGGMASDGGTLTLTGGRIRGNRTGGAGGGLSLNGNATVRGLAEFSLNTATGMGGGVNVVDGTVTLDDVRIYSSAGVDGGGLAVQAGTTVVNRTQILYNRNTATTNHIYDGGGGVYVNAGALTLTNCRISNNSSTYAGGGVMVNFNQKVTLKNCILSNNAASFGQLGSQVGTIEVDECTVGPGPSPGIWMDGGTLIMSRTTVSGHSGGFYGGGISLRRSATASIINSTISGNSTLDGGGIYLETGFGGASADLTNVTIAGNAAGRSGGNLFIGNGTDVSLTMKNTIIANPGGGGNCAGKEVTSSRYSISSDNLCALAGPGDRNGTNPLLGPLQNNGGATLTHMPLTGSPAIDGVLGTQAPPADQRGLGRPAGLGYDIGAVESGAAGFPSWTPLPQPDFNGNDAGDDDGDGAPDVQELVAGTDPASPTDAFRLSLVRGNPAQITFPTKTGIFYRLYVSQDFASAPLQQWVSAGQPVVTGNGGVRSFNLTPIPGTPKRFYRVYAMATDGPWP